MTIQSPRRHLLALICLCAVPAMFGVSACSSGGSSTAADNGSTGGQPVPSGTAEPAGGASAGGQPDPAVICPKLPVADAQALIRTPLTTAVPDQRLGGCTFVLSGNAVNDNNLTVAFLRGTLAAKRYNDDVNGTFSAGDSPTVKTGDGATTPLSGLGDKAVWGSTVGYPAVSALKADLYCRVSTADDATQLTVIGSPGNPLPQGTPEQQAQYAQLEGKLCADLFGLLG